MSKIILQPSGNSHAQAHYLDTVINDVNLNQILPYLNQRDINTLNEIYPDGRFKIWGVTPGGSNVVKWNRINRGDITLFARDGRVYASAVTTFKIHNQSLANSLWGTDGNGQTWEYIYFVSELRNRNIPYLEFNRAVGYADNYIIRGFSVLTIEQSIPVIEAFDLEAELFVEDVQEEQFQDIIQELIDLEETEALVLSRRRLEQGYLKRNLFGNNTIGECACCKKELPISYLVTAHIKKRSQCTHEERIDPRIVMPMCKFGCDEVYERGYVSVSEEGFVDMGKRPSSDELQNYIDLIAGEDCQYYTEHTRAYFDWHFINNQGIDQ